MPKLNFGQLLCLSAVRVWFGTFAKVAEIPLEVFSSLLQQYLIE